MAVLKNTVVLASSPTVTNKQTNKLSGITLGKMFLWVLDHPAAAPNPRTYGASVEISRKLGDTFIDSTGVQTSLAGG